MTAHISVDCELCSEVALSGAAVTGSSKATVTGKGAGMDVHFSRLVHRTSVVDVMAGLGCIETGYLLLIPRQHVGSMGELAWSELSYAYDVAAVMADQIRLEFGTKVVTVEHGSSGTDPAQQTRPACITHAHIHLFPIPRNADPFAFLPDGSSPLESLTELQSAATSQRNYYFCCWSAADRYLSTNSTVSSQHARRVWASLLGRPEEWDWALFPHLAACRETAVRLAAAEPVAHGQEGRVTVDDGQAETIAAYSAAASWYAERTRTFPPGSTLRAEIDALSEATDGWVLDAGAGGCRDAAHFGEAGRDVIAIDASGPLLAAGRAHDRVRKLVADVRSLPLATGSVGAVWCSAVLLHLDRLGIEVALWEFLRVLVPGGLAQISIKQGTGRMVQPMNGDPRHRRHFFLYEARTMLHLAAAARFEVVRTWTDDEADVSDIVQAWVKLLLRRPG
jgi:SAM-dependent methyltransferase/diadenosine tetraphosphate (Ap4A) HIT family hydrolase